MRLDGRGSEVVNGCGAPLEGARWQVAKRQVRAAGGGAEWTVEVASHYYTLLIV